MSLRDDAASADRYGRPASHAIGPCEAPDWRGVGDDSGAARGECDGARGRVDPHCVVVRWCPFFGGNRQLHGQFPPLFGVAAGSHAPSQVIALDGDGLNATRAASAALGGLTVTAADGKWVGDRGGAAPRHGRWLRCARVESVIRLQPRIRPRSAPPAARNGRRPAMRNGPQCGRSRRTLSMRVARWAHSQTASVDALAWVRGNELTCLGGDWGCVLGAA